jgi:hypothetical protein
MTKVPIIRTSERSSFRRCPQQWWWAYREGWTPKVKQADARWFGIGVHIALHGPGPAWYMPGKKRGPSPADTFDKWCGNEIGYAKTYLGDDYDEPVWEDAHELGVVILEEYVKYWGKDSQWRVVATERPFSVDLVRRNKRVATFRSRWDGVVRNLNDGRLYLLETKTASQISLPYLILDDQAGSYWAVAGDVLREDGTLEPDEQIAGIIYNFLKKVMPDTRPQNEGGAYLNKDNTVSKRQPKPPFIREVVERGPTERYTQLTRLTDEVEIMNAVRTGKIPLTKNTTRDCTWCDFFIPCQLHERGSKNWLTVMKADFRRQDPYEDTRKSAA